MSRRSEQSAWHHQTSANDPGMPQPGRQILAPANIEGCAALIWWACIER
jgi:hypothetical protein